MTLSLNTGHGDGPQKYRPASVDSPHSSCPLPRANHPRAWLTYSVETWVQMSDVTVYTVKFTPGAARPRAPPQRRAAHPCCADQPPRQMKSASWLSLAINSVDPLQDVQGMQCNLEPTTETHSSSVLLGPRINAARPLQKKSGNTTYPFSITGSNMPGGGNLILLVMRFSSVQDPSSAVSFGTETDQGSRRMSHLPGESVEGRLNVVVCTRAYVNVWLF